MDLKEKVIAALSTVDDPDLKKDLVTLNMIQDVKVDGNSVSFTVVLTTPACPLKEKIKNDCINAILLIDAGLEINIKMDAVVQAKQDKSSIEGIKNCVFIASGKGGVGKSTVAANVAISLAKQGAKVGLLDADIYGPSIPNMFGLVGEAPGVSSNSGEKNKMLPLEKFGVKILSIGFIAKPDQPVAWRGPMVSSALKQFLFDADWGELDYLLIDLPPGTGDVQLTLAASLPQAVSIMVTSPQQVAVADVIRAIGMFRMKNVNIPVLGLVENYAFFSPNDNPEKKYYLFGQDGGINLAKQFQLPFLGEIPIFEEISEGNDRGLPIALSASHPGAKIFDEISQKLAQQVSIQNARA